MAAGAVRPMPSLSPTDGTGWRTAAPRFWRRQSGTGPHSGPRSSRRPSPPPSAPKVAAVTVPPAADPNVPPSLTSAQRLHWQGRQRRVQVYGEVMRLHQLRCFRPPHRPRVGAVAQHGAALGARRAARVAAAADALARPLAGDPWRATLGGQRWSGAGEGWRNGARLWRDLCDAGFKGDDGRAGPRLCRTAARAVTGAGQGSRPCPTLRCPGSRSYRRCPHARCPHARCPHARCPHALARRRRTL